MTRPGFELDGICDSNHHTDDASDSFVPPQIYRTRCNRCGRLPGQCNRFPFDLDGPCDDETDLDGFVPC